MYHTTGKGQRKKYKYICLCLCLCILRNPAFRMYGWRGHFFGNLGVRIGLHCQTRIWSTPDLMKNPISERSTHCWTFLLFWLKSAPFLLEKDIFSSHLHSKRCARVIFNPYRVCLSYLIFSSFSWKIGLLKQARKIRKIR